MKNVALLLAALSLSACAPARANLPGAEGALSPSGGDDATAWFRLHSPTLEDTDGDGIWSAGEQLTLRFLFTNQKEDHYWYPGVLATSDVAEALPASSENWWYGIEAGDTYEAQVTVYAEPSLADGTVVTLMASASSLACDNGDPTQAEMCPDPNPLIVPVRIGDQLPL